MNDKVAELSEVFYPGTPLGLAKRYWEINAEIGTLTRERDNLRDILTTHCVSTGEVLEVQGQPPLRVVHVTEFNRTNGTSKDVPQLRFDRK